MYTLSFIDNNILLTATGAWFTDSAAPSGTDDIVFGVVKIDANDTITVSESTGCDMEKFLPGCSFEIGDLTVTNDGNVDIAVAYTYSISVVATVGNATYDLGAMKTAESNGENVLTVPAAAYGVYKLAPAIQVIMQPTTPAEYFTVAGTTLTVNENTGNYAYSADGSVRYILNLASDHVDAEDMDNPEFTDVDLSDATFTVTVTAVVEAIQYHELGDANLVAWAQDINSSLLSGYNSNKGLDINTTTHEITCKTA